MRSSPFGFEVVVGEVLLAFQVGNLTSGGIIVGSSEIQTSDRMHHKGPITPKLFPTGTAASNNFVEFAKQVRQNSMVHLWSRAAVQAAWVKYNTEERGTQ